MRCSCGTGILPNAIPHTCSHRLKDKTGRFEILRSTARVIKAINKFFGLPAAEGNTILREVTHADLVLSGKPFTSFYTDDDAWKFTENQVWKCVVRRARP